MSRIAACDRTVQRRPIGTLAAVLLALTAAAVAWQVTACRAAVSTVHVSTSGCRDATSWDAAGGTPFCSLAKAIATAPSGGRIEVAAGNYPALTVSGGSRTSLVTVAADGSGAVSLPEISLQSGASYLRFSGLTITGGSGSPFEVQSGSHDVQLVGSSLSSSGADAAQLRPGVHDVLFEGDRVSTTGGGYGIVFAASSTIPGSPAGGHDDAPIERVTVRGSVFDGVDGDAIRPSNFRDVLVEGNEFRNLRENGDHVDALQSVWGGTNLTFRGNYLHDNNTQGLFLKDGRVTNAVVENNIFVHNAAPCSECGSVQIFMYDVDGARIVNNTLWDNATNVTLYRNVKDLTFRNNIAQWFDVGNEGTDYLSTWQEDHNLIGGGNRGARGAGDIGASRPPQFVAAAQHDYRLKATSPGVDAGSAAGAPSTDKVCAPRVDAPEAANTGAGSPAYVDMGALEVRAGSSASDTATFGGPGCGGSTPAPPASGGPSTTAPPTTPGANAPSGGSAGTTTVCACAKAPRSHCPVRGLVASGRAAVVRVRATRTCHVRAKAVVRWRGGHATSLTVRRTIRAHRRASLHIALPGAVRRALARGRTVRVTVTLVGVSSRRRVVERSTVTVRRR